MTLSASQLRERWTTPAGQAAVRTAEDALRGKVNLKELSAVLSSLPGAEEVAPALDFRGIDLSNPIYVNHMDLSGARFDYAHLGLSFGGSTLRGAVFNGASGRNIDFGGCDLQDSSFVKAKLPGAIFYGAKLENADLTGIAMRGGQLKDAVCRNAKFVDADLRITWVAHADLRGADLRRANLVGASLGGVLWDSTTRFDAAQLSHEGTPSDIVNHALSQGASICSEKPQWQLSLLDATLRALESEEQDSGTQRMTELLGGLRPEVERNPDFLWANALRQQVDKVHWSIFEAAVRKAASNIGALLG